MLNLFLPQALASFTLAQLQVGDKMPAKDPYEIVWKLPLEIFSDAARRYGLLWLAIALFFLGVAITGMGLNAALRRWLRERSKR